MKKKTIWLTAGLIILLGVVDVKGAEPSCIEGDCKNGYGILSEGTTFYYGHFLSGKKHFWGCEIDKSIKEIYCGNFSKGERHLVGFLGKYETDETRNSVAPSMYMGLFNKGQRMSFGITARKENYRGVAEAEFEKGFIESNYDENDGGIGGCVAGACLEIENGHGVLARSGGVVYEGGLISFVKNGWGCTQFLATGTKKIKQIMCGNYRNDKLVDFQIFLNLEESFENVTVGFFDESWLQGVRVKKSTGNEFEFILNGEQFTEPITANIGNGLLCQMGACKEKEDGYSVVTNRHKSKDPFTGSTIEAITEETGDFVRGRLNGFGCVYSKTFMKGTTCGNFRNGEPDFFKVARSIDGSISSFSVQIIDRSKEVSYKRNSMGLKTSGKRGIWEFEDFRFDY